MFDTSTNGSDPYSALITLENEGVILDPETQGMITIGQGAGDAAKAAGNAIGAAIPGVLGTLFPGLSQIANQYNNITQNAGALLVGIGFFVLGVAMIAFGWGDDLVNAILHIGTGSGAAPSNAGAEPEEIPPVATEIPVA